MGAYSLRVYSLGLPSLDLGTHSLDLGPQSIAIYQESLISHLGIIKPPKNPHNYIEKQRKNNKSIIFVLPYRAPRLIPIQLKNKWIIC